MNRVTHFEIHASDPDRATIFYKEVFGWEITKWEGPFDYWMIKTGSDGTPGINGAIMRRANSIAGNYFMAYVCTVDVEDIDAMMQKVKTAGGIVQGDKQEIPKTGWHVYCKDTEGNVFGLMQPAEKK